MVDVNESAVKVSDLKDPIPSIPSLAALYTHAVDVSERIVCDESNKLNFSRLLEELDSKLAVIEGKMWLHICDKKDSSGKPIYTNDKQRQSAYDDFVALCKTDSKEVPESCSSYHLIFEEKQKLSDQIEMLKISISALHRAFTLNVGVIRSMGVSE